MMEKIKLPDEGWKKSLRKEINKIKPYIPGKPIKEVKEELGLEKVIKMASNENPLPISKKVKKAIEKEINNINLYPDGGSKSLKKTLCEGKNLPEEMVIFGNGSDGIIKIIGETFLNANSQVIISYPSFVEYNFIAQLMGSHIIRVWMRNYNQNLRGIVDAASSKTNLVFLTSPDNPTGTIINKKNLDKLLYKLPDNVIIVLDEAYYEYVNNKNYPDSIEYIKQGYPLIVLRTFSKAYGLAGLRLGYAISSPEIITVLKKARDPFNVNRLAQAAGKAALKDDKFLEKTKENNQEGKNYLYKELDKLGLDYIPSEANFILINVKTDSVKLFNQLLEKGIIIRPGKPLGYPEHIRVTIGLPEENKAFINNLKKVL